MYHQNVISLDLGNNYVNFRGSAHHVLFCVAKF